mmetsp:Transcript_13192/g.23342  ORF Transcript_13192/g.23342 Transcript_13192/m.23342 type:complete len:82 (-) Transcript_13192:36-281(-)
MHSSQCDVCTKAHSLCSSEEMMLLITLNSKIVLYTSRCAKASAQQWMLPASHPRFMSHQTGNTGQKSHANTHTCKHNDLIP